MWASDNASQHIVELEKKRLLPEQVAIVSNYIELFILLEHKKPSGIGGPCRNQTDIPGLIRTIIESSWNQNGPLILLGSLPRF